MKKTIYQTQLDVEDIATTVSTQRLQLLQHLDDGCLIFENLRLEEESGSGFDYKFYLLTFFFLQ